MITNDSLKELKEKMKKDIEEYKRDELQMKRSRKKSSILFRVALYLNFIMCLSHTARGEYFLGGFNFVTAFFCLEFILYTNEYREKRVMESIKQNLKNRAEIIELLELIKKYSEKTE